MKYLLLFLLSFSMVNCIHAQKKELASSSNKAIRLFKDAKAMYERRNYQEAREYCEKALDKDEDFLDAIVLMGYINIVENDFNKAIFEFEKVIQKDPLFFDGLYLELGILTFKVQDYKKSKKYLSIYLNERKPSNQDAKYKAERYLESSIFAINAIQNPVPFEPENLGSGINSPLKEYLPVMSIDQQTIVFTRTIPSKASPNGFKEDFYVARKTSDGWSKAQNMGSPLNSNVNEGGHTLTADGRSMVFTICEVYGDYGEGRYGLGSCDLFVSQRKANGWSAPKNLGPNINSPFFDSQPALSPDGSALYFSSARKGGYGKSDIYKVEITEKGMTKPTNLGPVINTPGREEGVFLHPDGKTMYFSSTGHPGMGNADIYMSRMDEDGNWTKPVNVGYPINTHESEIDFTVDALGEYAYFTSNRDGGFGQLDIYRFKMPNSIKPNPVTYLKGKVFDGVTNQPLDASFELIDLKNNELVATSKSLPETGEFIVALPSGNDYALNVSKDGYLFHSENFTLEQTNNLEPFEKNVPMYQAVEGNKVVLKNVFFDTDSYQLKPKSEVELNKLVQFLKNNPALNIEIGGHTDNVGNKAHNQTLSKNRAKSVMEYLVNNGIDLKRLSFKGYADDEPIASNDTKEGKALNRRTEFKIIGK